MFSDYIWGESQILISSLLYVEMNTIELVMER